MGNSICTIATQLFERVSDFMRKCLFSIISVGPVPRHIAFIMDGNRRYSKKWNLEEGAGHKAGYLTLMSMLHYCYELGVKYVTIYAFSIENFKRQPEEVQTLMDLLLEKMEELMKKESIINQYGLRIYFIGNFKLLSESVRTSARKLMESSAKNSKGVLLICVAYTSRDEIVHAVQESCKSKMKEIEALNAVEACNGIAELLEERRKINCSIVHPAQESHEDSSKANRACSGVVGEIKEVMKRNDVKVNYVGGSSREICDENQELMNLIENVVSNLMTGDQSFIGLVDVNRNMYMAVAPDPDILIRSSGETRLSNFLLW